MKMNVRSDGASPSVEKGELRSDGASPSKNVRKYDGGGAVATQGNDGEGAVATQVFPGRGVLQGVETYDGNHLPHWTMGHVLYHVCFRLADSVPVEKLREWQNERKAFAELRSDGASPSKEKAELRSDGASPSKDKAELRSDGASPSGSDTQRLKYLYSEKIEKYLDSGYGECLLRSDGALAVVRATIKHDDGKKYHIHAYGIMPNHVHVIVELKEGFLLRDVMQEWKSVSGHRINRMLSRTGALWQPDYYNHIIRTPDEYGFQMNYVFKNNLVESWRLPSNDESGNDGEGAVATQGNDGEGAVATQGYDGEGAVATQGKVTKIVAGVRSIAVGAIMACACLAGGAEPVRDLPFPLTSVRLTGGPLQAQQEQNRRYLLRLEPDRLLSRFRSEAGLKPKAEPYGGWENPVLKRDRWIALPGHILAFWMSGAAMTVEATGDEELKRRLLYVVDELEAVQNAQDCGYALATKNGRRAYAEIARGDIRLPDRVVNGRRTNFGSVNGVFDLVYVLNKMLIGLCRTHEATGSEKALRVFLRMSDWFGEEVVDKLDDAQVQKLLLGEHGSLPETYVWAWRRTGDEKHLRRARRLCHAKLLDPIIAGDADFLVGQHCNANIPKLFAALRVGDATGEPQFRKAAGDAWRKYALEHTVACGGNGCEECLFPASDFEKHLPHLAGAESCGSANMLRLTEALFENEPSAEKIDYYERVLFDHLLSTHDPILGRTVYHTPMRHATTRTYSSEFDSMWCCTGSGLETPAKYGQMVFTRASDDSFVRVNLFAPATLDWKGRGVKLRQATAFPYAETSCIQIESVGANPEFAVKVRRPAWAGNGFSVSVNGEKVKTVVDGDGYVSVKRSWKPGDRLDVEFSMLLRTEYLPGSKNYAAFFYGPVLLVGDDGSDGISKQQYVSSPVACEGVERSYCTSSTFESNKAMPSIPRSAVEKPEDCLERTACSPLTFRMTGTDTLLKPLFALHFSRYTTYWRVMGAEEDRDFAVAEAKAAEYARRAVDGVSPADYWSEKCHSLAAGNSETGVNIYGGPKSFGWRGAKGPAGKAFFSYRFAVGAAPGGRTLVARYRNCEKGARAFDVLVDGKKVFTESLKDSGRRGFIFREMPIPQELVAGKKEIEVRFEPKPGNIAGGLFGLWLIPSGIPIR